jgi:peptide deformylase
VVLRYEVLTFGNPVLREKSTRIESVTDEVRRLARDMLESMYSSNGLGLAAEQIGRTESICVIDIPPAAEQDPDHPQNPDVPMPLVLLNPRIVGEKGQQKGQEGCLSFPEIFADITRAEEVDFEYMDLDGNVQTSTAKGLLSRAIQHELDHLNGVLLVDRMSLAQRAVNSGKLKKIKKSAGS